MVSLVDIVPQTRSVETTVGTVELHGLGLRTIADLLLRFPELRQIWISNGAFSFDAEALIQAAPDAVGTIIATAADQPEAANRIAEALSIDDVVDCLIAIRELTMPGGRGPFVERLARLVGAGDVRNGRAADMNMPPGPSS